MIVITDFWADLAMIGMIIANILMLVFFAQKVLSVGYLGKNLADFIAYCIAVVFVIQVISAVVFAFGVTTDGFFFRLEAVTTAVSATINIAAWLLARPKDLRKSKNEEF